MSKDQEFTHHLPLESGDRMAVATLTPSKMLVFSNGVKIISNRTIRLRVALPEGIKFGWSDSLPRDVELKESF